MSHEENQRVRRQLGWGLPTGRNILADKPVGARKVAEAKPVLPAWLDGMEVGKWYSFSKDGQRQEVPISADCCWIDES